jgi:uncharacterized protein YqeY
MLYETLKKDRIQAMKDRKDVEKTLLGTLVGQIDNEASKSGLKTEPKSDAHVVAVVKKFLDDNTFTQQHEKNPQELIRLVTEAETLKSYLPQQLTTDELKAIIIDEFGCTVKAAPKGTVMKFLKDNHAGKYDGKAAAAVFDELQ